VSELHEEHPREHPKGTAPLPRAEAKALAAEVPGWTLSDERLTRSFAFKDFQESFAFATRVALLAEAEGHHPDIAVSWNRVTLSFWTHTADGLTRNDFIMVAKIDRF
jgi:4a-hydroxytetrahydrobiopterin dehydratase